MVNSEFRTIPNEEGLATRWVRRGVREAGEVGDAGHTGEAEGAWYAGEAEGAGYEGGSD